jgi:tRNA dimethylallyltransferase
MEPVIAVVGPTAVGKSGLAMRLAQDLDGEIVNADALQVYRGFDIGTAKPSAEEQRLVPHHLIDILDPDERYSAGAFAERGRQVVEEIRERGKRVLVVGGSGLYVRALLEGIGPLPPSQPAVRERLAARLETEGLEALWDELSQVDPTTARRLPKGDTQRIVRALEVHELSGRPLSDWLAANPFGGQPIGSIRVGLTLSRTLLYDRIASRLGEMMDRGWVAEVSRLLAAWRDPELPAFQAIGYRQLARHLLDDWPLSEATEDIVKATRRFSKRQMTWFRKEPLVAWFEAGRKDLVEVVERHLEAGLSGSQEEEN